MTNKSISFKNELKRKLIHLCIISLPIFYVNVDRFTGLLTFLLLALLALFVDIFSNSGYFLHKTVDKYLGKLIREHEKDPRWWKLNGASWVTISAFLTFLIFPENIAFTSFIILIISDMFAAIFGKKFGKPNRLGKSWLGTNTFITSGIIVVISVWKYYNYENEFVFLGIFATIVAGIAEALSGILQIDDNISIPFSFCLSFLLFQEIIS